MISISTRVDKRGFWYFVDARDDSKLTLSYIVIGTGGRQGSGEIERTCSNGEDWQYVEVGFPVLHVGITDFRIDRHLPGEAVMPKLSARGDLLSRRKSIRNIAAMLLAGWTMMLFPTRLSAGQMIPGSLTPGTSDNANGHFNPYSDDSFDPYFDPY